MTNDGKPLVVTLTRVLARLDIKNNMAGLVMTDVKLANTNSKSYLFPHQNEGQVEVPSEVDKVSNILSFSSIPSSFVKEEEMLKAYYLYEGRADSEENSVHVEIFTIEMAENTTDILRIATFTLANIFEPKANVIFTLAQEYCILNPLNYVAEFNLASAGVFATEQSTAEDKNGYYNNNQTKDKKMAPDGYHVSSVEECRSIVTEINAYIDASNRAEGAVTIHGETFTDGTYDSKKIGEKLVYALRFKEANGRAGKHTCAFRYQWEYANGMTITCRALGVQFSGNINTISNESYWKSDATNDVTRFFPICGYKDSVDGPVKNLGNYGYYWSNYC